MNQTSWSGCNSRFEKVISNLHTYLRKVDEIVDMMRLVKEIHKAETVKVINSLWELMITDNGTPCHFIPYWLNLKFYGRSVEIDELKNALDPGNEDQTLKAMSICGLAGVGKTQLTLHYANTSRDFYDAIAWIYAEERGKQQR
jgi:hypothetical protein